MLQWLFSPFGRALGVIVGMVLLAFGAEQASVSGLVVMFAGLLVAVTAFAAPVVDALVPSRVHVRR